MNVIKRRWTRTFPHLKFKKLSTILPIHSGARSKRKGKREDSKDDYEVPLADEKDDNEN